GGWLVRHEGDLPSWLTGAGVSLATELTAIKSRGIHGAQATAAGIVDGGLRPEH
ncbi:unnamed protein product, partial [Ectocarpus fasciculatus]